MIGDHLRRAARSIRSGIIRMSAESGVSRKIGQSRWRTQRLLILCYHGIAIDDEHQWLDQLFVTPDFLRNRFEIIRRSGCAVLPLGEAVDRLHAGKLPERSVVLTFDDGFYNYSTMGVPLLEEFGYPATNYVSTYYVLNQRPLLNLAISYMLWRHGGGIIEAGTFENQARDMDLAVAQERASLQAHLTRYAEELGTDKAHQADWLEDVAGRLGVDWNDIVASRKLHLMDEAEIADAASRGTDIQLHTHRHRTPLDRGEFCAEIEMNRNIIQNITGVRATHFCYPSGHVAPQFLPWLRESDVATATTGFSSLARQNDESLLLPRFVDTMHQTDDVFESWLYGVPDRIRPRGRRQ